MNQKRLPIAIAVLLGVAVVFVSMRKSRTADTTVDKPAAVLAAVKKEDVTSISLERAGKPAITLEKGEPGWQVKAPLSAKADTSAVDTMLDKLADLTVVSIAATRKENHERLEVDPAHAIHVIARGKDGVLADFFLGAAKGSGTMLRKEGEEQVLAVKGSLRYAFDKDLTAVRDRVITDIKPEDVQKLDVSSEKGTFHFEKGEKDWAQATGEKPLKSFGPDKVQSLVGTFAHLRASGFADPTDTLGSTGVEGATTTLSLTTKDGKQITLSRGKPSADGADYYLGASTSSVLYRVSKFSGDRMSPDAASFAPSENKPAAGSPPPGMPMAGGGQLPPEVMEQLQRQMAQQAPH